MNDNYKNLIILGNGFDIHLGLPTRWSDFVEFYEIIVNGSFEKFRLIKPKEWSFENFKKNGSKWINVDNVESYFFYALENAKDDEKETYKKEVASFVNGLRNCKMLKLLSSLKQNNNGYMNFSWSDFEHLIEEILDSVDEYVENLLNKSHCAEVSVFMNDLLRQTIEKLEYKDEKYFSISYQVDDFNLKTDVINSKNKFLDFIFNELINFTLVYKKYIDLIVDKLIQNHLLNMFCTESSLILTFNYTQDVDLFVNANDKLYVHGKANKDIIIGISNDQEKEERIKFSKNYMRVYNRVIDKDNKDNINQINKYISSHIFNHYYFLGHSLDKIDHSFLRQLFRGNDDYAKTKTTIFYYTEDDMQKKILNLYLMLGEKYMSLMLNYGCLEFVHFSELEHYDFNKS